MKRLLKRIRGWIGNAVIWGVGWALATIPISGLLWVMGYGYLVLPLAPRIAGTLFSMGFVAGGTFSTYLSLAYHNKDLAELRPGRFAMVGAVFGGLLVPIFGTVPGLLPGLGMMLGGSFYQATGAAVVLAGVLGGGTAFSTVKIAQGAALGPGSEGMEELESAGSPLLAEKIP
jgi:hypothetical protein